VGRRADANRSALEDHPISPRCDAITVMTSAGSVIIFVFSSRSPVQTIPADLPAYLAADLLAGAKDQDLHRSAHTGAAWTNFCPPKQPIEIYDCADEVVCARSLSASAARPTSLTGGGGRSCRTSGSAQLRAALTVGAVLLSYMPSPDRYVVAPETRCAPPPRHRPIQSTAAQPH
jgi:hypothetical protein